MTTIDVVTGKRLKVVPFTVDGCVARFLKHGVEKYAMKIHGMNNSLIVAKSSINGKSCADNPVRFSGDCLNEGWYVNRSDAFNTIFKDKGLIPFVGLIHAGENRFYPIFSYYSKKDSISQALKEIKKACCKCDPNKLLEQGYGSVTPMNGGNYSLDQYFGFEPLSSVEAEDFSLIAKMTNKVQALLQEASQLGFFDFSKKGKLKNTVELWAEFSFYVVGKAIMDRYPEYYKSDIDRLQRALGSGNSTKAADAKECLIDIEKARQNIEEIHQKLPSLIEPLRLRLSAYLY